jgi:hypothetical protein
MGQAPAVLRAAAQAELGANLEVATGDPRRGAGRAGDRDAGQLPAKWVATGWQSERRSANYVEVKGIEPLTLGLQILAERWSGDLRSLLESSIVLKR